MPKSIGQKFTPLSLLRFAFPSMVMMVFMSLYQIVDGIFISEEIGVQKPKKEFFDYCAFHVPDYEKDAVLIVGDSLTSDIRGGNLAGIDTCYLHVEEKTGEKEQDCRQGEFRITYEISSLKELAELLDA